MRVKKNYYYPVVFLKGYKKNVEALFPDFPNCGTSGETLQEAYIKAFEVLQSHVNYAFTFQKPSSLTSINEKFSSIDRFITSGIVLVRVKFYI